MTTHRPNPDGLSEQIESGESNESSGSAFAIFIALIFAALYVWAFCLPLASAIYAWNWVETPCEVIESELDVHADDETTTYSLRLKYGYYAKPASGDGKPSYWIGSRYNFATGSDGDRTYWSERAEALRPSLPCSCYVDAQDPSQSVIDNGIGRPLLKAALWSPTAVGPAFIAWLILRPRRARRWGERNRRLWAAKRAPSPGAQMRRPHKAGGSIVARIVGVLVSTLLALGLGWAAYALTVDVQSREAGQATPWGTIIGAAVLGLLSLGVGIATAYAPTSPLVELETDSERVVQGQAVKVRYRIRGKPRFVYGALLYLRCDDVDNSTEDSPPVRKTLYEQVVHEIVGATLVGEQSCTFEVPRNLPTSAKNPLSEIQWLLELRLTFAAPRMVREELALHVAPPPFTLEAIPAAPPITGCDTPPALHVTLGAAAPNALNGTVSWSLVEPATSVDLRVFWYTKRGREIRTVAVQECRIDASSCVGNAPFLLTWLDGDGPMPYKDPEFEVGWALEAIAQPAGTVYRTRLGLAEPSASAPNRIA